ncbi:hypothetical protein [Rhodoligotrophos defluvii]|uniref:hypothetical protein n=1 Tax=Rhodoligotrophos defluvii TaxID=2561934 RepID=UPI0010CA1240|nr:hypothetical protein [Rhodoligotrophos defluvii]
MEFSILVASFMSPSAKIVCVVSLLTVAGLMLCALLIYGSLDRSRVMAAESNLNFALNQLRSSVEANVSLGLPLENIRVAQDLVEQARAGNAEILAVEIFSSSGISLFNTDRGSIGEPIRETWREAIRRANGGRWALEEFGDIVLGEPIRNDFGEPVGYVAITAAGAGRDIHGNAIASALANRLAIAAPLALLLVGALSALAIRQAEQGLRRATERLRSTAPVAADAEPASGELPRLVDGVKASIAQHVAAMDTTAKAILALDEDDEADAAA